MLKFHLRRHLLRSSPPSRLEWTEMSYIHPLELQVSCVPCRALWLVIEGNRRYCQRSLGSSGRNCRVSSPWPIKNKMKGITRSRLFISLATCGTKINRKKFDPHKKERKEVEKTSHTLKSSIFCWWWHLTCCPAGWTLKIARWRGQMGGKAY